MQGIDWFNIKSGETVYTSRPAQIKAHINLSDLGINRQSDRGWRLGKEWTARLRDGREDQVLMDKLAEDSGGEEVSDVQILLALFNSDMRAAKQKKVDKDDTPFEQEYLESIKPQAKPGRPKNSN